MSAELDSRVRIADRIYNLPKHVHQDIERMITPFASASEPLPVDVAQVEARMKVFEDKISSLEIELAAAKDDIDQQATLLCSLNIGSDEALSEDTAEIERPSAEGEGGVPGTGTHGNQP